MIYGWGSTRSTDTATVVLPLDGDVLEVYVAEGDFVSEGQPLYLIDSPAARLAVEKAQEKASAIEKQIEEVYAARKDLSVRAPFSGTLINTLKLKEGDIVTQGTTVATIVDDTVMKLTLYFSYAFEHDITVGQSVVVSVPSMMSELPGTVSEINYVNRITPEGAVLFRVVISVPNPGTLTDGTFASAWLTAKSGETVFPYSERVQLEFAKTAAVTANITGNVVRTSLIDFGRVSAGEELILLSEDAGDAQLKVLNDQLKTANDELAEAEKNLGNFSASAPISGTVMSCSVKVGEHAAAGSAAVSIADTSIMYIDAKVDEMNIPYVKTGMPVDVTQWGRYGQEYFFGSVLSVGLEGSFESGYATFPLVIKIENYDGRLLPNMQVDYTLTGMQSENCLIVPIESVRNSNLGLFVFLKTDKRPENALNVAEYGIEVPPGYYAVPVTTGLSDSAQVEILGGLEEGQTVFTQFVYGAPPPDYDGEEGTADGSGGNGGNGGMVIQADGGTIIMPGEAVVRVG
jgi:multidrug resistance efflux pump